MSLLVRTDGSRPAARTGRLPAALATSFLVLSTVYFVLPVWWLVVSSTKTQGDLAGKPSLWFSEFALVDNLTALFSRQDGIYPRWIVNTVLYAGGGALVATVLAALAGYGLAKFAFRGRELIFSVVLGGVLVPATALALPLFLLFTQISLTDTFWSVFLPSVVSPFGVYLSRVFAAAAVPDELIEAARLDGAGELRIFATIGARLMSPALVTIFLFQFVAIWNNFFLPLIMLQDDRLYPVTLGLFTWQSQIPRDPQLMILTVAGSLVSVVPVVVAFVLLQRFWQAGLTAGAVKD